MKKSIMATDTTDDCVYSIKFDIINDDDKLDIGTAVRAAATEFALHTDKGREVYDQNCGCLNWGDIVDIPDEIFAKHGLKLLADCESVEMAVDYNEHLVDD